MYSTPSRPSGQASTRYSSPAPEWPTRNSVIPDLGLVTLPEMVAVSRRIISALEVPVIVDADDGYGNHLNVTRAVRDLEASGAAAIVLEDQVSPKKCGHFNGKRVVPPGQMVEKLIAARMARLDPDLVLVARTDAIAVEGIDGAIARARLYAEAGVDAIFVEAPTSATEMERIPKEVPRPCIVNMVEGGLTPLLPLSDLERQGYKVALYANLALRVSSTAVNKAFDSLRATGSSEDSIERMLGWEERQRAVDLPGWEQLDEEIAAEARHFLRSKQFVSRDDPED